MIRCTRSLWEVAPAGPAAVIIPAAMAAAAAVSGAAGSAMQGAQQQAAANYNAQMAERNAQARFAAATSQADALHTNNAARLAAARAAAGANGVQVGTGSPLDVMADLAGKAATDEALVRRAGTDEFYAGINQATLLRAQGRAAKRAGTIGAFTGLLTGSAQAAKSFSRGYGGGDSGGGGGNSSGGSSS